MWGRREYGEIVPVRAVEGLKQVVDGNGEGGAVGGCHGAGVNGACEEEEIVKDDAWAGWEGDDGLT